MMKYNKTKLSHKVISIFLILVFMPSILPVNYLLANNNGPKAPEAGSFEPIDATDMVSLLTGDVNYVLPLLNIPSPEGNYPITLAYHGGIAYDQDATWVGLGWNLNPGVINRTINGYPDDWSGGLIRNRNYYEYEVESINISLGVGKKVAAEIGVGYAWDSNGSQSGSVSMSIAHESGIGAEVGVGVSSSDGWSANAGASLTRGIKGTSSAASIGFNAGTNGVNGSIGYGNEENSIGVSFGTSGLNVQGKAAGIGAASYSSNQSSSPDVTTFNAGVKIPLAPSTYLRLGYSKMKFEADEKYLNKVWGPLHFNKLNDDPKLADDITYGNAISTEHNRDFYMDSYDQPLPQSEKEIIDYDDTFEKYQHSFSNPSYDTYIVNAQGLSGSMRPRLLQNGYLIGKGYKLEYNTDDLYQSLGQKFTDPFVIMNQIAEDVLEGENEDLAAYIHATYGGWQGYLEDLMIQSVIGGLEKYKKESAVVNHHFDVSKKFDKQFGNDLQFYFDHQLHSNLLVNENSINTSAPSNATNVNQFFSGIHENIEDRAENTNFIESFTNEQINSLVNNGGYFLESKDFNRANEFGAKPDGIGGYRITTADGKTYHYSQPVYHYEEFYRQLTPKLDSDTDNPQNYSEHKFYSEQRKTEPYATHWLLTAITGPDYIKKSSSSVSHPEEGDYGYWIRYDYGSWTDGYVWKNPKKEGVYNNLSFDKTNAAREYSWGRKQLVYLNKIVTRSHTALFVKSVREDNESTQIGFPNSGPYSQNKFPSYEGDDAVYYPKQKSLKLDEIILVKNKDDNTNLDNNYGNIISNPNTPITVEWETMSDISYVINKQNNVLDSKDLQLNGNDYSIYDKALKVIKLNQDYSLADEDSTSNIIDGRLTLNSVDFLGKKGASYMQPYSFEYIGENEKYSPCLDYEDCRKDAWGYDKDDVSLWSMNKIITPLGSEIRIEYEEDDYYTEAFARRFWTEGLTFEVEDYSSTEYKITVRNSPDFVEDAHVHFDDFFNVGEKTSADLWICKRKNLRNWDCDRYGTAFDLDSERLSAEYLPTVINATNEYLELKVNKVVNYGNLLYKPNSSWHNGDLISGNEFWQSDNCPATHIYKEAERGYLMDYNNFPCPGFSGHSSRHTMSFGLIANKIPVADTGGGIRAKSIATYSDTGEFFKVEYNYNHPSLGRSSGITSYAPVRGYKYVAYQAELPGPKVNYEYVSMRQVGMNGESLGKTQYQFDVLKPALDIFNKNLTIGNHFKSVVVESDLPQSTKGADVKLYDNTAMIGSLLSVKEYNSEGHLMNSKKNNYVGFDQLQYKSGSLQESFLSMKSIYEFEAQYVKLPFTYGYDGPDGSFGFNVDFTKNLYLENESTLTLKERYANVSTKITYPIIQESSEVISNGYKTFTEFLNPDPKTGEFLITKTTLPDGSYLKTEKVPAYTKYPGMGSKVDAITNKHMLTQETMNVTSWSQYDTYNSYNPLSANITTWNDTWDYRNDQGSEYTESGVWRKYKNFVWKDELNSDDGTYLTPVATNNTFFNWSTGEPTDSKWQNVSETTRYTHWSSPIEIKDINKNYMSSKMADNDGKVVTSSNSSYTEMYASSAEFNIDDTYLDKEVKGAGYRTMENAHTGKYSLKLNANEKGFETVLRSGEHSEDNYKISVWVYKYDGRSAKIVINGEEKSFNGEQVDAGAWTLFNHYEFFKKDEEYNISINTIASEIFIDDFRIHPIYSSMNTYVYDEDTDELTFILDNNNMATKYVYDNVGRLCKTYAEVENNLPTVNGGFKLINQYKYHFMDEPDSSDCECCDSYALSSSTGGLNIRSLEEVDKGDYIRAFNADVVGGSGNYTYQWRWLTDYESNIYTNYVNGNEKQDIPFAVRLCDVKSNSFNKVWKVELKVTDNDTGEIKIKNEIIEMKDCNSILSDAEWANLEISSNYESCNPFTKYTFRPYVIKPEHSNYSYQYQYYDHILNQWSGYFNIASSKGNFCTDGFYVPSGNCKSQYMLYQTIQYRVINNENGDVFQSNVIDVYLDCVENASDNLKMMSSDYHDKYANFGSVVEKNSFGEVTNNYDFINQINNKN